MRTELDGGRPFDWGKAAADYAKYRDIYPQMFYDKILDRETLPGRSECPRPRHGQRRSAAESLSLWRKVNRHRPLRGADRLGQAAVIRHGHPLPCIGGGGCQFSEGLLRCRHRPPVLLVLRSRAAAPPPSAYAEAAGKPPHPVHGLAAV